MTGFDWSAAKPLSKFNLETIQIYENDLANELSRILYQLSYAFLEFLKIA